MNKTISFVVLSLAASVPNLLMAQADFRKANWGMTKAQVVATELTKPSQVNERGAEVVVRYDAVRLVGLECRLVYIFAKDKLVRTKYVFQREHTNKNDLLGDFTMVDTFLVGNYEQPSIRRVSWRNDLYKAEPQNYGLAVSLGHLQYATQWSGPHTVITHALSGYNGALTHEIEYVSVELEPFEYKVTKEAEEAIGSR